MENTIAIPSVNDDRDIARITQVLNNENLKTSVTRLTTPGVINLITPNWRDVLYNNAVFQRHRDLKVEYVTANTGQSHLKRQNIYNIDDKFQILVVGLFKVIKSQNRHQIAMVDCKPLLEIAKVMCIDTDKILHNHLKFFMKSCNGICPSCRMETTKIPEDNIWCASETKVFTPEGLNKSSREYCAAVFNSQSLAIVRLEIDVKFSFSNFVKIGGNIKSIIFIQENLLLDDEEIVGFLNLSTNFVPQVQDADVYAIPNGFEMKPEDEYEVSTKKIKL